MKLLIVASLLVCAAIGPSECLAAQEGRGTTFAVDALASAGAGRGGEFRDRQVSGARIAASVRRIGVSRIGVFAEVAMDWLDIPSGHYTACLLKPGGCFQPYPEFAGAAAIVGLIARPRSWVEARAGIGGGAYSADATRAGAVVGDADVALFPFSHVGVAVGVRSIVVPNYRGDRLTMIPWTFGLRIR